MKPVRQHADLFAMCPGHTAHCRIGSSSPNSGPLALPSSAGISARHAAPISTSPLSPAPLTDPPSPRPPPNGPAVVIIDDSLSPATPTPKVGASEVVEVKDDDEDKGEAGPGDEEGLEPAFEGGCKRPSSSESVTAHG